MSYFKSDIQDAFVRGIEKGARYMIIWCDSFDHEDYPSYYIDLESAIYAKEHPGNMQRYMESYDLSADMEIQLNKTRAYAF